MQETFFVDESLANQTPEIIAERLTNETTLPTGLTVTSLDGVLLIYCLKLEAGKKS